MQNNNMNITITNCHVMSFDIDNNTAAVCFYDAEETIEVCGTLKCTLWGEGTEDFEIEFNYPVVPEEYDWIVSVFMESAAADDIEASLKEKREEAWRERNA
jgi:hypothetical protein